MVSSFGLNIPYALRDPEDILAELKQRLTAITKGVWSDFLESDIGYMLLKAMVELLDHQAFYTDAQLAECFLSTCMLRESAIRKAKELNYTPARSEAATVEARLTFPSFGTQFTIAADSTWRVNGQTFVCSEAIEIPQGQTSLTISLQQGSRYSRTITGTGADWYKITVPLNISELEVRVNGTLWTEVSSFIAVPTKTAYRVYEDKSQQTIQFGSDLSTYKPKLNDVITVKGILTSGAKGNSDQSGLSASPTSIIRNSANIDVTNSFTGVTTTTATGGQDLESISAIKANAPGFYATQGRTVTEADFEAVIRAIPGVVDVRVTGGEKVGRYGEVIVTVYGADPYTVNQEFLDMIEEEVLALRMVTITPVIDRPDIVEVDLVVEVSAERTSYTNLSLVRNAVNTALVDLTSAFKIGASLWESDALAAVEAVGGIRSCSMTATVATFAASTAGVISIPLCQNYNLSSCILRNAAEAILFSGNGASKVVNGNFVTTQAGMADQICTLSYVAATDDVEAKYNQVVLLKSLTINVVYVS